MRQKAIYILAIISCLSFFSAAEQTRKICNNTVNTKLAEKEKYMTVDAGELTETEGPELSAMNFFIINF